MGLRFSLKAAERETEQLAEQCDQLQSASRTDRQQLEASLLHSGAEIGGIGLENVSKLWRGLEDIECAECGARFTSYERIEEKLRQLGATIRRVPN